ncbi:MAG: hypothetical protein KBC06_00570 [Candidatus Pacebacteria bacterium]|nr:hypothetical protein [Candidatus Paceibacterota bacterium]
MGIFSGIFSTLKKEELVLVFDVGSSSTGGALFYIQKSGVPKIIFSVREPILLEKDIDADRFLSLTTKSLEIISAKISKSGFGMPKKIFCVLSSPWYASQTRTINMQKNAPFVFNTKLADSLIDKEISLFEEQHLQKYMDSKDKIVAIELKNMKTMLNGYATDNPYNQKATELQMVMFISMSGEQVLEKIKEVVCKNLNCQHIKFSSFAMASYTVARDMFAHHEDFVLIDIGGEVTDVSIIKKDILTSSTSFPVGPNYIIRGVASELNTSLEEAKSLLSLYKDGHAEEAIENKLEPIIAKLKKEWLQKFQASLMVISNDISIPSTIFVSVDKEMAGFFGETIKSDQLNQYTLTESNFQIIFLNAEVLHSAANFNPDVARDPFLIIESIYINRFLC